MKNTTSFAWLIAHSAMCILSATAEPAVEPQVVQIPDEPPPPLTNLVWKLPPQFATLDGDRLVVDIPTNAYPSDAVATATLPAELFAGAEGFSMTVSAEGSALARPTREWLGLKFQVHWKESASRARRAASSSIFPPCAAALRRASSAASTGTGSSVARMKRLTQSRRASRVAEGTLARFEFPGGSPIARQRNRGCPLWGLSVRMRTRNPPGSRRTP